MTGKENRSVIFGSWGWKEWLTTKGTTEVMEVFFILIVMVVT